MASLLAYVKKEYAAKREYYFWIDKTKAELF